MGVGTDTDGPLSWRPAWLTELQDSQGYIERACHKGEKKPWREVGRERGGEDMLHKDSLNTRDSPPKMVVRVSEPVSRSTHINTDEGGGLGPAQRHGRGAAQPVDQPDGKY